MYCIFDGNRLHTVCISFLDSKKTLHTNLAIVNIKRIVYNRNLLQEKS